MEEIPPIIETHALTRDFKKTRAVDSLDLSIQPGELFGLVGPDGLTPVPTTVWGYGDNKLYTWPGRTFQVKSYEPLEVKWENRLGGLPYVITGKDNTSLGFGDYTGRPVVDTSLHWAYSLHGYEGFSIEKDGVPIVAHVHGGHSDFQFDGRGG